MVGMKKPTRSYNTIPKAGLLNTYINNPKIASSNYSLGVYYYKLGQFASALSFFLRGAEIEDDKETLLDVEDDMTIGELKSILLRITDNQPFYLMHHMGNTDTVKDLK